MTILLDIDGVLVTTPSWKPTEQLSDGFMKFNETAVENLAILFKQTNAAIVLTTTHRINFDETKWIEIFKKRGLNFETITKLNDKTSVDQLVDRATEIKEWVELFGKNENYVIIDDDPSINGLPDIIKERWVSTRPLIGFDKDAKAKAFSILTINAKFPCPCCGHKTFSEKPNGSYNICPVCFWEDDPIQLDDPDYEGGANPTSLKQAQKNFIDFGACDEGMKQNVRQPATDEPKDKAKPFDENNAVEYTWNFLLQEDDSLGLKEFIILASKDERLSKLFPFTSLYTLCFSKCTSYPFDTTDLPNVTPIEYVHFAIPKGTTEYAKIKQEAFIDKSKTYVVTKNKTQYIGEGKATEVLRIIRDNLPDDIKPARKGTADN